MMSLIATATMTAIATKKGKENHCFTVNSSRGLGTTNSVSGYAKDNSKDTMHDRSIPSLSQGNQRLSPRSSRQPNKKLPSSASSAKIDTFRCSFEVGTPLSTPAKDDSTGCRFWRRS